MSDVSATSFPHFSMIRGITISCFVLSFSVALARADDAPLLFATADGRLARTNSTNGDAVPDFSYCGFEANATSIPDVVPTVFIEPSGGDDTFAIQSALDQMARRVFNQSDKGSSDNSSTDQRPGDQPWRGAVVLAPGVFRISATLYLRGDHIVLRGSHTESNTRTEVHVQGKSRRPAIVVGSDSYDSLRLSQTPSNASNRPSHSFAIVSYAPIGTTRIMLEKTDGLNVGQSVSIVHPSTQPWIEEVGMRAFPDDDGKGSWLNWKANTVDQTWNRNILSIDGNAILLDAPITSSIDPKLTQGRAVVTPSQSNHHLGVESLTIVSDADTSVNTHDEEHAWDGIRFCGVFDAWARNISFRQFSGSAVHVGQDARRITVSDCHSSHPISENAGWRRQTFFCMGQQTLFLRCTAEDGRHDFSTGPLTSGPNAFVYCSAKNASQYSGPIGSWSTGVLYDNVEVDGHGIQLTNRETDMAGSGWVAANCVLWNCVAPRIVCRRPPTAFNIAIGIWGEVVGNGTWRSLNEFVSPDSLFEAQLSERLGKSHSRTILDKSLLETASNADTKRLSQMSSDRLSTDRPAAKDIAIAGKDRKLAVTNGWLTIGDQLAIGKRQSLSWWRGSILPARASEFGAGLTRFVPGLDGTLFTNSVPDLVSQMTGRGAIALEHHWGLWYDRRRDDHQMIRRMDAEVWPPFYEQPWARSGQGRAWDGLSKYDLSRFNTWYFDRLSQFANAADRQGLILLQHMYFQHNVLEAGAHWADFPWRTANCIQDVGFDEPPVYENRKRVFMAEAFYDVSHPVRREMHTRYIRHCLDTLSRFHNVVFVLGEEYSGPTHFVKFWLDTIRQWSSENNRDVLVMLSACRNVQEEILASAEYASMVDIIDVKYWWHTSGGELYDPPGGQNQAPRQQLRTWSGAKSRTLESTCKSVRDLKARFPEKAVTCSLPSDSPWMLLAAGCSLPELPDTTDEALLQSVVHLMPQVNSPKWSLISSSTHGETSSKMIVDSKDVEPDSAFARSMRMVNSKTGKTQLRSEADSLVFSENNPCVVWIDGNY
jgi:hypothetical protein